MMLSKCCTQYVRRSGKLSGGHRTGKDQSSRSIPKKGNTKNVQTTGQLYSSPMIVRLCSKSCVLASTFVNIFATIKVFFFFLKQHFGHGIVKPSLRSVYQDFFTWWAAEGRKKYTGRAVCGRVHIHILMITMDVCASLGCAIGVHC